MPHPLTNFEIQRSYENDVYSRNHLPKIKDEAYVINLDESKSVKSQLIYLYVNGNNITCLDSVGIEDIQKFIGNKNIIANIYRKQAYDSIMYGYFYI